MFLKLVVFRLLMPDSKYLTYFKISDFRKMPPVSLEDMFSENKTQVEGSVAAGFEKVLL